MKRIYLDHAAATYVEPKVKAAMEPYYTKNFGNASALYEEGRVAKKAIKESREKIASILGARPEEIIFTGSGTEGDNLAVLGVCRAYRQAGRAYKNQGKHIITTKIEHPAVLEAVKTLEKEGFKSTILNVNKEGIVDLKQLKSALTKDTILVSVMYANNEIGAIQPIAEIAKIIRDFRKKHQQTSKLSNQITRYQLPFFHTDAVQAANYLDLNVSKLGVDLLTLNGSKIYGPKGIGALYVRKGVKLESLVYGGGQEFNIRSGTENIAGIVGLAKALELVQSDKIKESKRLLKLRDKLIKGIAAKIPDVEINGSMIERLPNNANFSIFGVEGESVVLYLDAKGISCSTGSACHSSSLEPSHVIMAIQRPDEYAHGSIRFSLGRKNSASDVNYVLKVLPGIVKTLRRMSALI